MSTIIHPDGTIVDTYTGEIVGEAPVEQRPPEAEEDAPGPAAAAVDAQIAADRETGERAAANEAARGEAKGSKYLIAYAVLPADLPPELAETPPAQFRLWTGADPANLLPVVVQAYTVKAAKEHVIALDEQIEALATAGRIWWSTIPLSKWNPTRPAQHEVPVPVAKRMVV